MQCICTILIKINANCYTFTLLFRNFASTIFLSLCFFIAVSFFLSSLPFILFFSTFLPFLISFMLLGFILLIECIYMFSIIIIVIGNFTTFTAQYKTYHAIYDALKNTHFWSEDRFRKTLKSLLKFSWHC